MSISSPLPDQLRRIVGPLPECGRLPNDAAYPFEVVTPGHDGFVQRDGVHTYFAVFGKAPIVHRGAVTHAGDDPTAPGPIPVESDQAGPRVARSGHRA